MDKEKIWKKTLKLDDYIVEENNEAIRIVDEEGNVIITHEKCDVTLLES